MHFAQISHCAFLFIRKEDRGTAMGSKVGQRLRDSRLVILSELTQPGAQRFAGVTTLARK